MIDKLEEVISLLAQHGKTASSIVCEDGRIEVHGLTDYRELESGQRVAERRKEPTIRELMFMHSMVTPQRDQGKK